ncbi:hypothetical protein Tco_0566271 [Tanacetum coccineum]
MVVPIVDKSNNNITGYTREKIRVEYEWKPPLCLDCHIFDHRTEQCPKRVKEDQDDYIGVDTVGETSGWNDGYVIFGEENLRADLNKFDSNSEVEETLIVEKQITSKPKGEITPYDDVLNV